jgi:hypothetical protein
MKAGNIFWFCIMVFFTMQETVCGQGFVNLDFEEANVPPTPTNTFGNLIDPALAFPGWTVLPNNSEYATTTAYNDLSLGDPAVILMGPDFPNRPGFSPLQGCYSVLLEYFGIGNPPGLSQTGLIPADAQSISILGEGMVVTLNGINIPMTANEDGGATGNISAFAGESAQLTISTSDAGGLNSPNQAYFDEIQFSTVPEPNAFSLLGVGILFICRLMKRPSLSPKPPTVNAGRFAVEVPNPDIKM